MVIALRRHLGVLGVVMTFLAVLFAAAPIAEAAACAADACGVVCVGEEAEAADQTSSDCPEQHCIWSSGHHHPAAVSTAAFIEAVASDLSERVAARGAERVASASPNMLERPPRG